MTYRKLLRLASMISHPQRFVNNLQVVIRELLDASGPVTALLLDEVDHVMLSDRLLFQEPRPR